FGLQNGAASIPGVQVIRIDQIKIFVVLPRDHGESAADATRKQSHPFVPASVSLQRRHPKGQKVTGLEQLGSDRSAAVSRVGCVERLFPSVVELHESSVLDAVR